MEREKPDSEDDGEERRRGEKGYELLRVFTANRQIIRNLGFHIEKYDLTEAAFNNILSEMDLLSVSSYRLQKAPEQLVPFEPILVDCSIDSRVAFTKEYGTLEA